MSSQSDLSDHDDRLQSCIVIPDDAAKGADNATISVDLHEPHDSVPSTSVVPPTQETLPTEILEALGDPVGKEEILGPAVKEEIAKRWGRILVEGMTKETKESLVKKTLIPENFCLAKAPNLNLEISAVLSETVRNRDKLMEKSQNQLGLGIAGLANLASSLIDEELGKVDILKKLSEVSQIFLDLHFENTKTRRKLVTSSLDKKFNTAVADVKRDAYLFGTNLGDKIKATKTAEKSGLQIKRRDVTVPSTSRQQGNWKGPPRMQPTRNYKQGGPKTRYQSQQGYPYQHSYQQGYQSQQGRRPPPAAHRAPHASKADPRNRKPH